MKRSESMMKFIIAAAASCICIAMLAGCGSKADAPEIGRYDAVSYEMSGYTVDADDSWFELREKGKVVMNLDGTEGKGKYEIDDDEILLKMDMGFTEISGTIDDGGAVLELDEGVTMNFVKEGAEEDGNDEDSDDGSGSSVKYGHVLERLERAKDGEDVYGYGDPSSESGTEDEGGWLTDGYDDTDLSSGDFNLGSLFGEE